MISQREKILGYWKRKEIIAQKNMAEAIKDSSSVLIEVASQHPLDKHSNPNPEFSARLDVAYKFWLKLKNQKREVKIYIAGSRHLDNNGIADKISLSQGGINYLMKKGIPKSDFIPASANEMYTNNNGVYSSGDESLVTSKLFFEYGFGDIWTICGPYQLYRKTLNSIEFGVFPKMFSVPVVDMHHSCINELFVNIPNTLYDDHGWQNPQGEAFINCRKSRKPGFKEKYEKENN